MNLRTKTFCLTSLICLGLLSNVMAGTATTNANATSGFGPGSATANAAYTGGGQGRVRTDTRTGTVNFARGMAIGTDRDSIDFSVSYAVASPFLPAAASTFNLSIGRDGSVSSSNGLSVAGPAPFRSVTAGGFAGSAPGGSVSGATVSGRSEPFGTVHGQTWSNSTPPRRRPFFRR